MNSDENLYHQTLKQYNDPTFAKQYADNIEERLDLRLFDEFLPLVRPGGTILDIACAAGRDTHYLASRGFKSTGVDYSSELIKIARQKHPDIAFIEGDFTDMSFTDASFDAIWCKAALVHLPSQAVVEKALREFWRVLKPEAAILIRTKARMPGDPETAVRVDKLSSKTRYFRFQEEQELTGLMEAVGFKLVKSWVENEQVTMNSLRRDENWLTVIATKAREVS